MSALTLTRGLAWSAAQDAANASMRAAGRSKWSQDDYQLAVETFDRLWPKERDYTERGEVPVCRTPVHCGHVHHVDGDPTNGDLETRLSELFPGQPRWTCPGCGRHTIGGYCNGCGHRYEVHHADGDPTSLPYVDLSSLGQALGLVEMGRICVRHPDLLIGFLFTGEARAAVFAQDGAQ